MKPDENLPPPLPKETMPTVFNQPVTDSYSPPALTTTEEPTLGAAILRSKTTAFIVMGCVVLGVVGLFIYLLFTYQPPPEKANADGSSPTPLINKIGGENVKAVTTGFDKNALVAQPNAQQQQIPEKPKATQTSSPMPTPSVTSTPTPTPDVSPTPTATPSPIITITSPTENQTIQASSVKVSYSKSGELQAVKKIAFKLDGEPVVYDAEMSGDYTVTNIGPGIHTLKSYFVDNNDTQIGSEVAVRFTTE